MANPNPKKPATADGQNDGTKDSGAALATPEEIAAHAAEPTTAQAPAQATAATLGGMHAEVQAAVKATLANGEHAAHAALSGIETVLVELRMKLASFEHVLHDDVQGVIAKIKAFL